MAFSLEQSDVNVIAPFTLLQDTSLRTKGIFIRAVVPDSPAARCGKLAPGDRILAVNGVSLLGLDYQRLELFYWNNPTNATMKYLIQQIVFFFSISAFSSCVSISGKQLMQSSGDRLRLLVAKSDWMTEAAQTYCWQHVGCLFVKAFPLINQALEIISWED